MMLFKICEGNSKCFLQFSFKTPVWTSSSHISYRNEKFKELWKICIFIFTLSHDFRESMEEKNELLKGYSKSIGKA